MSISMTRVSVAALTLAGVLFVASGALAQGQGRGGGGRAAVDASPTFFDSLLSTGGGFYDFAMGQAAGFEADKAANRDRMSQRFADAQMVQDLTKFQEDLAKAQEKTFLEGAFGKLKGFVMTK